MPKETNWKGLATVITALAGLVAAGATFVAARYQAADQNRVTESAYNVTAEQITQVRVDVAGLKAEVEALKIIAMARMSRYPAPTEPESKVATLEPKAGPKAIPLPRFREVSDFVQRTQQMVNKAEDLK